MPDARAIATTALGRDAGPLTPVTSRSHQVHVGSDVVVKLIAADDHSRLNREIALAPHLPPGITAPLLASGREHDVRYACYARVPGTPPRMEVLSEQAALALARQAIERLDALHAWTPPEPARRVLSEAPDHGGFTGRDALVAATETVAHLVPPSVLDALKGIASRAPLHARSDVPVHADCYWDNWLAQEGKVTALLDFEWARFGDPLDDWFFLARFSGPHMHAVLDLIAEKTGIPVDVLRVECEVREASHLMADLPFDQPRVLELLRKLVAGLW